MKQLVFSLLISYCLALSLSQAESYIDTKCTEEVSNVISKYADVRKSMIMFKMPSYLNQFGDYDACQTKSGYQYVFSSVHGIARD